MPAEKFSVLVLGLDGATFDLMLPWVEEGHLPHLRQLLREGAWSRLRSTIPPITPCAWSSFMTGTNPVSAGWHELDKTHFYVLPLNLPADATQNPHP